MDSGFSKGDVRPFIEVLPTDETSCALAGSNYPEK